MLVVSAYAKPDLVLPDEKFFTGVASSKITSTAIFEKVKPEEKVIDTRQLRRLSEHPQWQHLLYYKNGKAEVLADGFYLSEPIVESNYSFSPYDELVETLKQSDNKEVICKFPARYFWLSHHLEALTIDLASCATLPNPNQSISLLLISNYLKNPASSFGHVLVKTNDHKVQSTNGTQSTSLSSQDLLNDSYNFGARIPENENGMMYAIKGLFGFYDAGFSATEFFKQDAVYSKNEQRDMWEYVLNLDTFETQLLNYHLFETKSARFDYYFIKQNCGYRSGEILELISDIKTTEHLGPWYAPDYIFDQLVEYNANAAKPLIASVRYLPSEQTQLRYKFGQLPKSVQQTVNHIIKLKDKESTLVLSVIDSLDEQLKVLALDYLVLHQTYKISQNDTLENQDFKKLLISERFKLAESDELAKLKVPNKPSPALSNKTTKTLITLSDDSVRLGLSLFVKDPLNLYTDINKRFEAIKTTIDYSFEGSTNKNGWVLHDFVIIDMQQIEDLAQPLEGEPKLAWQLKAGARNDPFNANNHRPYIQGGVGGGAMLDENMVWYLMTNAVLHDQHDKIDTSIEIGLRAKKEGQAVELNYNHMQRRGSDSIKAFTFTFRKQLTKNNDARLWVKHIENSNISSDKNIKVGVAWHHYW